MPKYRVRELSLIGNDLFQEGATVDYDGLPAENLEPLCDEGKAKYQEYLDSNAARVKKMRDLHSDSSMGDPAAFAKAIADAVSSGIATAVAAAQVMPAAKAKAKESLV